MSKINILIVAAVLLSSVVLASVARPDSTLQSKSTVNTHSSKTKLLNV